MSKPAKKRAAGKKLIGFQASESIRSAIDLWLSRNPQKSVSNFILEASMEKLDAEGINYDRDQAIIDGRYRRPLIYPDPKSRSYVANETAANSAPASPASKLLSKAGASTSHVAPK